jgi:hypothetical protein
MASTNKLTEPAPGVPAVKAAMCHPVAAVPEPSRAVTSVTYPVSVTTVAKPMPIAAVAYPISIVSVAVTHIRRAERETSSLAGTGRSRARFEGWPAKKLALG